MPEIAEVALMTMAIREIMNGKKLTKITVLGGRYLIYHIKNEKGEWTDKIINPETGRKKSIDPKKYPGGEYFVGLANLDKLSQMFPINIKSINVKGKFSWIELDNDWYIGITFGMSGGIYYEPTSGVLSDYAKISGKSISKVDYMKHFHIKFEADDGSCFYFGDPRRFGTITISDNLSDLKKKLNSLGPDMLTGELIEDEQFIKIFRGSKYCASNICKVLMGQEAISGVGNYIKAEVLYECKINPWALVSDLDDSTLVKLHKAIREIAQAAFKGHGASLYTYTGTRREKGSFQNLLKVYDKSTDPYGNKVIIIPEEKSPDARTTHYVKEVQTIGAHRDPSRVVKLPLKLKLKLKPL